MIAESEPSKGRPVGGKVDAVLTNFGYDAALATKARTNELPRARESLGDRWMAAIEHWVELPSNESGFVCERFSRQSMDHVLTALVRELRGHSLLVLRTPSPSGAGTSA